VTVLAQERAFRISYCPTCMADLLRHASGEDDAARA
jgi:hypothetical protein